MLFELCLVLSVSVPAPVATPTALPDVRLVPDEYATIQAAITASGNGDEVLVAPGRYVESLDFQGKAIRVRSSAGPASTTIDGGAAGADLVGAQS